MSGSTFEKTAKVAIEATNALVPSTPQLDYAITNSRSRGLPNIAIGRGAGKFLSMLCQLVDAKNILEIGVLGGYSTIWLANSVPGVKVTSIEYNPENHAIASENVKGLDNVEILLGAGLDVLPKIAERGTVFDFVFIDADWDNQANYFEETLKMTRKGGIIFIDNGLRPLTEIENGRAAIDRIKADSRVEAVLVPALNLVKESLEEALDGFIMVKVK